MKFAACVVLYYPTDENIINLLELSEKFDCFMVWDNSENSLHYKFKDVDKYIHDGNNHGLAKPYNFFLDICYDRKIDILCILDQDSLMNESMIIKMKKWIINHYKNDVAIFAPRLYGTTEENWVINSNSFLNVNVIAQNNIRYDEFYFLDRLDTDFCHQIVTKELEIKINENVIVEHRIGEGRRNEHTVSRHYYMFRNRRYYNYKFYHPLKAKILTFLQDVKHLFLICAFEKNKLEKIGQLWKSRK